jgi:hypothetical protein
VPLTPRRPDDAETPQVASGEHATLQAMILHHHGSTDPSYFPVVRKGLQETPRRMEDIDAGQLVGRSSPGIELRIGSCTTPAAHYCRLPHAH